MLGSQIPPVLAAFPAACASGQAEFLGNAGGLSGAQFWRLDSPGGRLCLRRWPAEHPSAEQLKWIHQTLQTAVAGGFARLPLPLETRSGESWVLHDRHLWQLEPWLSGAADWLLAPSDARLRNAMQALAEFHRAVVDEPLTASQEKEADDYEPRRPSSVSPRSPPSPEGRRVAPGIVRRRKQFDWWTNQGVEQLRRRLDTLPPLAKTEVRQVIEWFQQARPLVEPLLKSAETMAVRLSPSIRDVWHDNILFIGDEVSGIVDFGAMEIDSVAADVARLLGSLANDDAPCWRAGLESYQAIRQLSPPEIRLVEAYDQANTLLAPLNWMRWLYLEERQFDHQSKVRARIEVQLKRLKFLLAKA